MAAIRRRERLVSFAIAVLLLQLAAYANATDSRLEILPSDPMQRRPVGSSILLTCKPKVDDPSLVTDMQWHDPNDRVIESLDRDANTKPNRYTELHQDGSLSLFFKSLEESQGGDYTCQGTYARNVQLTKNVKIDPIIAITWDNAPLNQYPIRGENFDIQCRVRAKPSPSIDWFFNGKLVQSDEHYAINAYSLTIRNVQDSDDGIYTCRALVETTGEFQERPIRVEVHVKPVVREFSQPVDIIEGDTANIKCNATGKPPPRISWIKSLTQQNLSIADRFGVDPITGIVTISNVNREDEGEYQCIATNAAGVATTNIRINVIIKPKIMEFVNVTAVQGNITEIMCKAYGRPAPGVLFRKFTRPSPYGVRSEDDRIHAENKKDELNGETIGILRIHNVSLQDDGLYECMAQNLGGTVYKNGHLTVESPPSFENMPKDTVWTWSQRSVNLTCTAEGIPNATIRWRVGGREIVSNVNDYKIYGYGPTSILTILVPFQFARSFVTYQCIATNKHGTKIHDISVAEAHVPQDIQTARMIELTATTIKFEVIPPVSRDLPITTITVQYKEERQQWQYAKNKTWSIGSLFVVEGLKPQTMYEFRFAARNNVGMGGYSANIVQTTQGRGPPVKPSLIISNSDYEMSKYSNQYEVAWLVPPDNGEPIDMYLIKYCQMKRFTGSWDILPDTCVKMDIRSSIRTRQYIKDLNPDTYYNVELRAHNAMGYSEPGEIKFRTTKGLDTSVLQHQGPLITSGAIIGIVLATIFIIFIIIDAICCCVRKTGIIYYTCERSRRKPVDEEESKLGRDEKEPLKEEKKITPIIDSGLRRESSITFDGTKSVSKTGFVGKDSAV